ncbi:chromosome segregation and condensation protein B [Azotobacter vinelandii CA]|uniref:Chromosome segregation and condensation protein B n=2 Tax=Azotobacter vinelandii TaxID=354 RepID=C1DRP4_AZOVD|nr:SMC-Scp complex subunit ScpB [Azotobacter vinelandii]ACO77782.1 chromosome segregation and condensation protein B [Azotobacter vinelandii DJ]AGK13974.1 chromosome segregation and condensation protein B [Azotobacter vinelandii CA]AGK18778.1 chromosome segregation and condensation protein B [Azotobacter vinelandii CA6]WKN23535.1 SMC-Scp complex subunit ScpB [Azotobacter vinelandii]SFX96906.1 condensin subunit ScpB [Azotobacter vinelandii]
MNLNDPAELAVLLEAWLLAAGRPLSLERLGELFEEGERPEPACLRDALAILARSCQGRAFELKEVASGYRLQVRERFAPWVGRLWEERPQRYSRALLETLALIAYRQPISRGEIEEVRGVAVSSNIIRTLQEREWIRVVGYREVPGRPALFATTRAFLDHFNLKSLDELPPLAVLRSLEPGPAGAAGEEPPVGPPLAGEAAEPAERTSFRTLLAELDAMEQGLKTDFDDLPETDAGAEGGMQQVADDSPAERAACPFPDAEPK